MNEVKKMQQEEDKFRKQMEDKHMTGVENEAILKAVWSQAWEYGHSSGFDSVEDFYIDLSILAKTIIEEV